MVLEEDWSVSPERARQFFRDQPDVLPTGEGFQYGGCQIQLTPVRGMLLGKWPQARTLIRMEGPEADTRQIYRRFFLQFLSAGG